jgi:hypothetical protein
MVLLSLNSFFFLVGMIPTVGGKCDGDGVGKCW